MMSVAVLFGIFAVLSRGVTAQILDFSEDQSFEESLEDSYKEDSEIYSDFEYDDSAWFEIEYKIQQLLLNGDEYVDDDDYVKEQSARGIPMPMGNKLMNCVEKLHGPFYTIKSTSSDEHIYPSRYFNITCVHDDRSRGGEHHRKLPIKCEPNKKRECVTTIKEVPVFRKISNKHHKNCWKPEKLIPVETGCKCNHL